MKKEARVMVKAIFVNITDCLRAKSRPGKAYRPKELAWRAEKALPGEEISR
jgi:hypothetical protein